MVPKLQVELGLTPGQGVWVVNLLYVGVGVGSLVPLLLMDRIGRRWTMLVAALPKAVSWLLFAVASSPGPVYLGRLLAGVGTGITYCVTPMYLGEVSTPRTRGPLSASLAVWINVGLLLVYALGLYLPRVGMSLVALSVPLLFVASFVWLPASPVFLAKRNRLAKAEQALRWSLARENVDAELDEILRSVRAGKREAETSLLEALARPESRRAFHIVAILLSAMIFSGAAPILAYQVDTFEEAGFGAASTEASVLASGLAIVLSGVVCVLLVRHTGKRALLLVAAPVTVASHASVGLFFGLRAAGLEGYSWVPTVCIMVYALFYGVALNPLPLSYISEVFPVDVKVPAAIFTSVFYALGSVFVVDMYQVRP